MVKELTKAERTKAVEAVTPLIASEDADGVLAALGRERSGYETRMAAVKNGVNSPEHADDTEENLTARLKGVDAEIARVKKSGVTDREVVANQVVNDLLEAQAEAAAG